MLGRIIDSQLLFEDEINTRSEIDFEPEMFHTKGRSCRVLNLIYKLDQEDRHGLDA